MNVPTSSNCFVEHGDAFQSDHQQHIRRCRDKTEVATGSWKGDQAGYSYTLNIDQGICGTSARGGDVREGLKRCLQKVCKNYESFAGSGGQRFNIKFPKEGERLTRKPQGIPGPQRNDACEKESFQMKFKEKKRFSGKNVIVRLYGDEFRALSVSQSCFKGCEEVVLGTLKFEEFFLQRNAKMVAAHHWKDIRTPVMDLVHISVVKNNGFNGVGSLLFLAFTSFLSESDADWRLIITNAGTEGPAFYYKIGYKMVGDYVQGKYNVEQRKLIEEVENNKIRSAYPSNAAELSKMPNMPISMMMSGDLTDVHGKLTTKVGEFWKIK
jgi:hypothetical protein